MRLFVCKTRGPAPRKQKARRHCGDGKITIYIINTFMSSASQKRIWAQAQNFLRNGRRRQAPRRRHGPNGPCLSDGALHHNIYLIKNYNNTFCPQTRKNVFGREPKTFCERQRRRQAQRRRHGPETGPCLSDGALPPSIGAEGGI